MQYNIKKVFYRGVYTLLGFIILSLYALTYCLFYETHEYTALVTGVSVDSQGKYYISVETDTGDWRTFQNTDSIVGMKTNSEEIQEDIFGGGIYEITVTGYRIPCLDMYENIKSVELIN